MNIQLQTAITQKKERQLWKRRYLVHRCQARYRREPYKLTEEEFVLAWHEQNAVPGRRKGSYCITRLDPRGAWEVGNIQIQPRLQHYLERSTKQKFLLSETKSSFALYQEAMELEDIKLIQQEVKQTLDFFVQPNKSNLTDVVGLVAMEWGIEVLRKHFTLEEIAAEIIKAHNGKHNQSTI
jgi:hypothetical protein